MENRYDKYKDSGIAWIGEIPEHWEIKRLKNICSQTNIKENSKGNPLPYIGLENIESGSGKYIDTTSEVDGIANRFCKNNVLFGKLRPYLSKVYLAKSDGICSTKFIVYDTKENDCHFIHKLLLSQSFIDVVNSSTYGAKMPRANSEFINNIYTQIPPIQEQQHISTYLDQKCGEIDELITLQEEMITKLQSYKQSVITEAVTKGLDKNVPLKDSGIEWIGEIPEHWEVKRMKSIYNFGKGLNITKADLVDKGISVISYGQIHSKLNTGTCIKDSLIKYVPEIFLENNNASLVKKGDIIFADTSEDLEGCGNCIYIDRDMLLYAGYHTIIAKNISTYINRFFSYLFQTDCWRSQIRKMVNGVKLFSIPQKLLSSTDIITPSLSEQQSIADYLDQKCSEIDKLISIKQQKIEKLKDYKKSLIFECVTGKRKVS